MQTNNGEPVIICDGPQTQTGITMLDFDAGWRYESPGTIPDSVLDQLLSLIRQIAIQADAHAIYEIFKEQFAHVAGRPSSRSSNLSWAENDLATAMNLTTSNGALFCEAFYDASVKTSQRYPQVQLPPLPHINSILGPAGYTLDPPKLILGALPVHQVTVQIPSMEAQAVEIIQRSLSLSDQFLATGKYRPAVQEILWLLETVSTAFKDSEHSTGTVQGAYFNKIVKDLKRLNPGLALAEISNWMTHLHGYLSSPTGGGIRHGTELSAGDNLQPGEAKLYCDLTRSYISYLLSEHARLCGK